MAGLFATAVDPVELARLVDREHGRVVAFPVDIEALAALDIELLPLTDTANQEAPTDSV